MPLAPARDELRSLGETLNAMLERIDAALDRERTFVADASHEMRTPLAILRAEIDLALGGDRSADDLRAALVSAGEETDRLSRLADDLLVLARVEHGTLPVRREAVELGELLETVAGRFRGRAGAGGREIAVDATSPGSAMLDRLRIEQALGNLVDNALRHGAGVVVLRATRRDGEIELAVVDQGQGFAPSVAEVAFERFTRGDPSRGGGGAGLGLSIVRAIARAHGGEAAATASGGGTEVRICVPDPAMPNEDAPATAVPLGPPATEGLPRR
jgi:signal transduction histidine kinase